MFVKLGQLLSTRPDIVPPGIVAELAHLRDQVAPAVAEAVRGLLEAELGGPVAEVFAAFDWEPLAAASIGQVSPAASSNPRTRLSKLACARPERFGAGCLTPTPAKSPI